MTPAGPAGGPAADPPPRAGPPRGEGADSILGDPDDSDDSVIATPTPRKPVVLPPETAPTTAEPVPPPAPPVAATLPEPVVKPPEPADDGNPFAGLGSEPPPPRPDPASVRHQRVASAAGPPAWMGVVLIALAGYAALMTALAAWGWLR